MDCQECQERPATLHFTQVINGNKKEVHVCEVCAKEKGYKMYQEEGYSLHDLLSGLINFETQTMGNPQGGSFQQVKELQCPKCEMTFSEFKRIGKFGCAVCYDTFSERLDSIFRRVHSGNAKHHGKIPKRQGGDLHKRRQIESHKSELKSLIESEEFEKAAEVRDKIKALENGQNDGKEGDHS